jgi:hypothetical protein
MKRSGWVEPANVRSHRWRWGHDGVDVFSFTIKTLLGLTTHAFDDVEWSSGGASSGCGPFADIVRCPFESFWWSDSDGGVGLEKPFGECCIRLQLANLMNSRKERSSKSRLLGACCRIFRSRRCVVSNTILVGQRGRGWSRWV